MIAEDMTEKKLRGSGGYAIARVTDEEQKKGNLGGPELFLAGIGRLEEDRFVKHYCNKCEKAYEGSPALVFENPNEELGEGVILIEKGEYKCKTCNATIAQYRKFDAPAQTPQQQETTTTPVQEPASRGEEESPAASPPPHADPVELLGRGPAEGRRRLERVGWHRVRGDVGIRRLVPHRAALTRIPSPDAGRPIHGPRRRGHSGRNRGFPVRAGPDGVAVLRRDRHE